MLQLETEYRGSTIKLEFDERPRGRLRINGLVREQVESQAMNTILRLSSTVQTDYEWHEFILAIVDYSADRIDVRLLANNQEITQMDIERGKTP
jgi:hypothetical protein